MQLPIGLLIFWANKFEENHSVISGMWYYKEIYVPSSVEEKKKSISDFKENRCKVINIYGRFEQIKDVLSLGDLFINGGEQEVTRFSNLVNELENSSWDKPYFFDDIRNIRGTAFMVDPVIEIDETMDAIKEFLGKGKAVEVNIAENWSLAGDIIKEHNGF